MATAGNPLYQVDVSPDAVRWQTVLEHEDLVAIREMAKALLREHALSGMKYARVQPAVEPVFEYTVQITVREDSVN